MSNPILLDLGALQVESFDVSPEPTSETVTEPVPEPAPLTPTWEKDCTKPLLCPV